MRDSNHLRAYQLFFVLHCAGLLALRLALDGEHARPILELLAVRTNDPGVSWQLVTHVFLHLNPLEFTASAALLLFLGGPVERLMGTPRFCVLYLGSAAACALAFESLAAPGPAVTYVGGLGAGSAVLVASVLLEPRKRLLGVVPAPGFFILIATAIFATTIYLEQEPLRFLEESWKLPPEKWLDSVWELSCRESVAIPHLSGFLVGAAVFAFDLGACWAVARVRVRRQIRLLEEELDARERVDALLEKISREGVDALSRREKKFLKYASARFFVDRKRVLSE